MPTRVADLVADFSGDTGGFDRAVASVNRTLDTLGRRDTGVEVTADTDTAERDVATLGRSLDGLKDEEVLVGADATDALNEIRGVDAGLAGLADETIGITADSTAAQAEVRSIEASLARVKDASVRVNVDSAEANAEVANLQRVLAALKSQAVRVDADTREAQAEIRAVEGALASLKDRTVVARFEAQGTESIQEASGATDYLAGALAGAGKGAAALKGGIAGIVGSQVLGQVYELGQGALELSDAVNATNVVFGDSRRIIDDWATNSVNRVGLSENAFRNLAAPIGAITRSLGVQGDEVANLTNEIISLGADYASVLGGSTQERIAAITSAFKGEYEAAASLGVNLNAAVVQQRALELGMVDASGEITNQAAVIRDLILESARANGIQGDFNRTQGEGVNAIREAGAALEDAGNAWGSLFAPAVEAGARRLREFAEASQGAIPAVEKMGPAVGAVGEGILDVLGRSIPFLGFLSSLGNEAQVTASGFDIAAASAEELIFPVEELGTEIEETGNQAGDAAIDVDALGKSIDSLIGVSLNAEQQQIRFREALAEVSSTLRENGATLDINSEKGRENRESILSATQSALGFIEAQVENGATLSEVSGRLEHYRSRLIESMVQQGFSRRSAEEYINTLGLTPTNIRTLFEQPGMVPSRSNARGLRDDILSIPGAKHIEFSANTAPAQESLDRFFRSNAGRRFVFEASADTSRLAARGDGPGGPTAPRGGRALDRVNAIIGQYPGLRVTSTYRSYWQNRAAGGSPTSYHMDRNNPAVDIGGPTWQLDRFDAALGGGWREKLWRVPGHFDHVHVAHEGGRVDASWPTMPGLRADERPVIAQVGETIIPASGGGGGGTTVIINIDAHDNITSSERDLARMLGRKMGELAQRGATF